MFGWKRLEKDFRAIANTPNLSDEQYGTELGQAIGRFGTTNFVSGAAVIVVSDIIYECFLHEHVTKFLAKRKHKKLKDTDK